jgi:cyclase
VLTSRVIPVLLYGGHELVKGQKFDSWRSVGSALQQMQLYAKRGVDELIFLDVSATREGREPDYQLVKEVTEAFDVPVTVGGGISTYEQAIAMLRNCGADKVAIGTHTEIVPELSNAIGCQSVVVSIDHRGDKCFIRSGAIPVNETPWDRAERLVNAGAGEVLLNSIDRDGTMQGYDIETLKRVTGSVGVPVIVCGGCSGYEDMEKALEAGAAGVAAGALFTFTQATPRNAARHLRGKGFHVRI